MYNAANNASSQLAQAISAADTSLTVVDASNFPEPPFVVSIEDEIIEVGAKSGNTFSALVRGAEGTIAAAHPSGTMVENRFTAGTYTQIVGNLNRIEGNIDYHANRTDNPHGVTAAQVGAAPSSHVGAGGSAHAVATTSTAGFMSASDKVKLDGLGAPPGLVITMGPTINTGQSANHTKLTGSDFLWEQSYKPAGKNVYFEAIISSEINDKTCYVYLKDESTGETIATISRYGRTLTRVRSAAITLTHGRTYAVYCWGHQASGWTCYSPRLIIV